MLAEIGQICLILAVLLSFVQGAAGLKGAGAQNTSLMQLSERCAIAQAVACLAAFACLASLFMQSDFSSQLVYLHSHTSKPMIYKFSGTWGNHEGSMLLWVMLIAMFGAAMVWFGKSLPASLRVRAVAVQGLIGAGFGSFLLLASNPFLRLYPAPLNGRGLNPVLQDPGLALHPPFLYLGYVGFSVAFAFAVAALIEGRVDSLWARWIRPWVLLAWSFLTIGITLGSIWAYYELGWGGWWAWDPVENVSFMPWLAGTALLHSTLVVQARSSFIRWTVLLAILTFSLSLIGTFIVRSGILTSVHAFAVDPGRGIFLLLLLILATGGALLLYYFRADKIEHGAAFEPVSREGGLVLNNLLLLCAIATVFLGTFYPLVIEALTSDKITVGPPYYNMIFAPIMTLLIAAMAVGPMLKWKRDTFSRIRRSLLLMSLIVLFVIIVVAALGRAFVGAIGFGIAAWLLVGTLITYGQKLRIGTTKVSKLNLWGRFRTLPAMTHGFALAHIGMAITVFGVAAMSSWSAQTKERLKLGEKMLVGAYTLELVQARQGEGPNYLTTEIDLRLSRDEDEELSILGVESRFYPVERETTSEGSMDVTLTRNVYAALGEGDPERGWVIDAYYHPLVSWIWGGAIIMAIGGFVSLADRRIRVTQASMPNSTTKKKLVLS